MCCVGNDNDLRAVTLGADGAFAGMKKGATFVDHTTGEAIEYSTIVFPTVLMLMAYLGFHFLMIGLLAELAVHVLRGAPRHVVRVDEPGGAAS